MLKIVSKYPASSGSVGALSLAFTGATQLAGVNFAGCAIVASGGSGTYTLYGVTTAGGQTGLPAGITVNTATGIIGAGQSAAAGTYTFTGHVTDSLSATASCVCTLNVGGGGGAAPLSLGIGGQWTQPVAAPLANCYIVADGGSPGYTYSLIGAPGWLSVVASGTGAGTLNGTPPEIGVYTSFSGHVVDSASTAVTLALTLAIVPLGPPGEESANAVISSVSIEYGAAQPGQPGDESWVIAADATLPSSALAAKAQAIVCETMVLCAIPGNISNYGVVSCAASANFGIYVTQPRTTSAAACAGWSNYTCTVGSNGAISVIKDPLNNPFNPALASVAGCGYVLVAGTLYGVSSWTPDGSACQLTAPVPPCSGGGAVWPTPGSGVAFVTLQSRGGNITVGDTVWILGPTSSGTNPGYAFVITAGWNGSAWVSETSGWCDQCGRQQWQVTAQQATPNIPGWTLNPASPPTLNEYVLDINGAGCNGHMGDLFYFTNAAVSDPEPMGGPSVYWYLMDTISNNGTPNSWPVYNSVSSDSTPGLVSAPYNPFAVEQQISTALRPFRASTQAGPGIGYVNGQLGPTVQSTKLNSASQLSNFNFAFSGVDWAVNSGAVDFITNDSTGYAQTGESYAQIWNASGGSRLQTAPGALIPCTPGSPWAVTASFRSNSGPNAAVTLYLLYFTAANAIISGYVSVSYNSSVDAGWVAETVSSTAPSNASYVGVQIYYGGSTGLYAVDNVYLVQPAAVGGGLGLNSSGAVIVLPGGITSTQLGAAAVQAANVAAAAITGAALAVGAITNPALAADCVQAANIVSLTASQITADSSIVGQLQAGTVTAAVSFTAPSLTITNTVTAGGYTTVNLLQVNSTFNILATQTVTVVATGLNYLIETCEVVGTGISMSLVTGPGWTVTPESYSAQYDANLCEIVNNENTAAVVVSPDSGLTVSSSSGSVYVTVSSTGIRLPQMATLPSGSNLAIDGSGNLRFYVGGVWKTVTVV